MPMDWGILKAGSCLLRANYRGIVLAGILLDRKTLGTHGGLLDLLHWRLYIMDTILANSEGVRPPASSLVGHGVLFQPAWSAGSHMSDGMA